ncbi:MAG: MoaF N-terminal domain-containing protein [Clostridiales Family XIII bacterium]|jgi:hypothetical protein|nr:MoaF N-terminal domain-containing protein [Clostridiales Family XIII bacterium]
MDLREKRVAGGDVYGYCPPMSYAFSGKNINLSFIGGESAVLEFSEAPERELSAGGNKYTYYCTKAEDDVYLISFADGNTGTAIALDFTKGLAVRATVSRTDPPAVSFGGIGGAPADAPGFSNDLDGSVVEWVFGGNKKDTVHVEYTVKSALVKLLDQEDGVDIVSFNAVRVTDQSFLQIAEFQSGGAVNTTVLLSNFAPISSVGVVFASRNEVGITAKWIGAYGRIKNSTGTFDLNSIGEGYTRSIDQYCQPRCFELAGETFELVMDDGYDMTLHFISGTELEWQFVNGEVNKDSYECRKSDDTTYLVSFNAGGVEPRVNYVYVIDKENWLVTKLTAAIGKNPRYPYLIKPEFVFGAIRRDGAEVKLYPRHGFTSDVMGNVVQWVYACELSTIHVYYCTDFYRITYPRDPTFSKEAEQTNDVFMAMLASLPSSDEPTHYVKIKDGMYLISLTESNCERLIGPQMGARSDTLCFLDNFKRGYNVGRGFGTMTPPAGGDVPIHCMIGAYGTIIEPMDEALKKMVTDPNPYII